VKIIEVDGERRRLSLSLKRVEDTDPVQPRADGGESVHTQPRPTIDLSEEVFAEAPVTIEGEAEEASEVESPFEVPEAAEEETPSAEADATGAGVAPAEEAPDDAAVPEAEAAEPAAEPEASAEEPEASEEK